MILLATSLILVCSLSCTSSSPRTAFSTPHFDVWRGVISRVQHVKNSCGSILQHSGAGSTMQRFALTSTHSDFGACLESSWAAGMGLRGSGRFRRGKTSLRLGTRDNLDGGAAGSKMLEPSAPEPVVIDLCGDGGCLKRVVKEVSLSSCFLLSK